MSRINKEFLVIVPARRNSKRVPNKNIRILAGQPLIVWTFHACSNLPIDYDIFVTTDCPVVQELAISAGYMCPELRPEFLSQDDSSTADVVRHTIDYCHSKFDRSYENIILLQPTSPLRTDEDIIQAIELFRSKNADAVQSYSEAECPPMWVNNIASSLSTDTFIPEIYRNIRSQDLGKFFRINGAIYIIKTASFTQKSSFLIENSYAYIMPRARSIDIDDEFDFTVANLLKSNSESCQ